MRALVESDIVKIFREEWQKKICSLQEQVDAVFKSNVDGQEATLITKDLKVKHKDSGLLYTVDVVNSSDVILKTPEGDKFLVDSQTLEQEYEIA